MRGCKSHVFTSLNVINTWGVDEAVWGWPRFLAIGSCSCSQRGLRCIRGRRDGRGPRRCH